MKKIALLIITLICPFIIYGQELNATVTVNSDRIQGTNKQIFTTLETALNQFINGESWSSATFATNEKIECNFSITIAEQNGDEITAELFVQARRPVYNSSYITTLLNWRDTNFKFNYTENSPIEKQDNYISSNLVAVIDFYCQLILALDFDSFSPLEGASFLRSAQSLATTAQSSGWEGWSAFDDNKSRTSIINSFNEESMKAYRDLWYTYHRKGLDEMAANPDRARTTILKALPTLKEIRNVRGSEIILQMFADCKLDEVVAIAGKATAEEKKEAYDLLRSLFPTQSTQLEPLKK